MAAEEVEARMAEMRGKDRRGAVVMRCAATDAFEAAYAGHMMPATAVAALITHLVRHPTWDNSTCAAYIVAALDGGDTPRYLTSAQTEAIAACRGRALHDMPACSALVPRTIDPWNLTWDGMDGCTLECLQMRSTVFPLDDGDIWAWLQSRAARVLRAGGNCCACGKAWPGWRGSS